MPTPPLNLITDVPGLLVGNADDARMASGVTVALFERPAVAAVVFPGGAPSNRDTTCLAPEMTVDAVDGIVLSGGSAFGLDAASGAQAWLRERGRGLSVRSTTVPIVPAAICFDLLNGGDKDWGRYPPYRELAYVASEAAAASFALGTIGAGYGATTVDLKGGLGSASTLTTEGYTVGALVVVNALGSAVIGAGPHFWAAPWERHGEFGDLGSPVRVAPEELAPRWKGGQGSATTLALVATDAPLGKAEATRVAQMATAGLARGLRVTFAPMDGDTVFAASTGRRSDRPSAGSLTEIGSAAADCVARAIARAIYEATALPIPGATASWQDRFGDRAA